MLTALILSSGIFTKGNITKWSNETSILINKIVKNYEKFEKIL